MAIKNEIIDVAIIGSGPAGYTAAIYAARAGFTPVVYTGLEPGGQLTTTTDVENFPGYPEGIDGPAMMEQLKAQAERFGTQVKITTVTAVTFSKEGGTHLITLDDKEQVSAHSVIIATGASAKYLGLESESRLMGAGVSGCAICDGFFYKGLEVAVIGGGDTAAEEASYLSKICKKVYLLVRKEEMRASKAMQQRVESIDNVEIHYNTEVEEVLGKNALEGLSIINNKDQGKQTIKVEGVFVAIGHKPNTDIFKGQLNMDEQGYLITEGKSTKTNIAGVFASGDVQDKEYRQAITAAGSGCMAALDAERYLAAKH